MDRVEKELGMLLMEPYSYRPWEIGLLTDSQVDWLFRSSARYSKTVEAAQKGEDSATPTFTDAETTGEAVAKDFLRKFNIPISENSV